MGRKKTNGLKAILVMKAEKKREKEKNYDKEEKLGSDAFYRPLLFFFK